MKTPNYRGERMRRERDQKSKKQERLQRLEEASAKRKLSRDSNAAASEKGPASPPGSEPDEGA
jgi:hypothetical protein